MKNDLELQNLEKFLIFEFTQEVVILARQWTYYHCIFNRTSVDQVCILTGEGVT